MRASVLGFVLSFSAFLLITAIAFAGTPDVLWHRTQTDVLYTSTGIAGPSGVAFAGTYFDTPRQVEAVPLAGDGTPDWVFAGTRFFVDSSRDGDVLAAVDFDSGASTGTVRVWAPGSSTPLWTQVLSPCRDLVYQGWASRKPIQVSDDGSTLVVALSMDDGQGGYFSRVHVFDATNPTPTFTFDLTSSAPVALELTPDGNFAAVAAWPTIAVYDCVAGTLRWSGGIGAGNDCLAISSDGHYLGWGWSTFNLREWNGSSYAPLWTDSRGSGYYAGQCSFSNDGTLLALTWDNGSSDPNEIYVDLIDLPSLTQRWEYSYGSGPGTPTDVASRMVFSNDDRHFAVASWGGTFPEIHVFSVDEATPVFVLDTPGSMFDIDIYAATDGTTYVTACGKDVHAGFGGRGGDFYAIEIPGPPVITSCGVGAVNANCGPVEDVLTLNGSAGGSSRTVNVTTTDAITLTISEPTSRQGDGQTTDCCVYAWLNAPGDTDVVVVPKGLGEMCFGPFVIATKVPKKIWNSIGSVSKLGTDNGPGPEPVIPNGGSFNLLSLPGGAGQALTVTFQGIVEDDCSQGTVPLSVTNGFALEIVP